METILKIFVIFMIFMCFNHVAFDINKNKLNKKIGIDETIIAHLEINFFFINLVSSFVIVLGIEYLLTDVKIDFSTINYIFYFQIFDFLVVSIALAIFIIAIIKSNSKDIFVTNKYIRFINSCGINKSNPKHPMNDSLFLCNEDISLKDIKNISIKKNLFGNILEIKFLDNTSKFLMYLKTKKDIEIILNNLIGENKCKNQNH